jgi:protein tyrosine/serine phosphatase
MVARAALLLMMTVAAAPGCATVAPLAAADRPRSWSDPLPADPDFPNLQRVTPTLYRCAQPTAAGLRRLADRQPLEPGGRPVQTVVSLRLLHDDDVEARDDADATGGAPLRRERIRFKSWHPDDEEIVAFLRIATTPALQPVLVHCHYGADRTGTMVAAYRIVVEGWTKEEAVREMTEGGFGFHPVWNGLCDHLMELDVAKIRRAVAAAGPWP